MQNREEEKMSGKLFVVGTPIGNLQDMTFRGIETLKTVDFICAEDTRVTTKLLNYFEIKKPLVSYHEHNARQSGEVILRRILGGESCAIVTDAGMPCISDPGEELVKLCADSKIEVCVVPGPTAAMSAVAISGLNTKRFSFEGFLSTTKKNRTEHLQQAAKLNCTMIFYEAPHKLIYTLQDMLEYFGDRKISLCRELTKIHEEVIRTTIGGAIEYYSEKTPRGEYVLVVDGAEEKADELTLDDAVSEVKKLTDKGMKPTDACKFVAKESPFSKSQLYARLLENDDER